MDSIILQTGDTTVTDGDVIGRLGFAASSETGTNARLVVAKIEAVAEESFDASNNATEMVFSLAADGAAASKMTLTSAGNLNLGGELQTTNIGYTDGDNSMTIADGGKVTFAAGFAVGSDAAGDILYHNGTSYVRLGIGSDGQVLTVNDAGNAPQWEAAAGGGGGAVSAVANGADNRVATFSSSDALNGEANLTFDGSTLTLTGHLAATTKSFLIDHPSKQGMKLQYASLEGPENGVYVRGTTSKGFITLPDYWKDLVDSDSITVTLTPVGQFQPLFVEQKNNREVRVGGVCGYYDYVVWGERKDVEKLEVEW